MPVPCEWEVQTQTLIGITVHQHLKLAFRKTSLYPLPSPVLRRLRSTRSHSSQLVESTPWRAPALGISPPAGVLLRARREDPRVVGRGRANAAVFGQEAVQRPGRCGV